MAVRFAAPSPFAYAYPLFPDEVRFVKAIPRTSVGKINKQGIREAIVAQDVKPSDNKGS